MFAIPFHILYNDDSSFKWNEKKKSEATLATYERNQNAVTGITVYAFENETN